MPIADTLLPEFDQEMAITRKVLERVPDENGAWKPHEKSFPMGHLAQLVAGMPGWLTRTLRQSEIDLANVSGYSLQKTSSLVQQFDQNVREARQAIAESSDADFGKPWALRRGEQVLMSMPRAAAVRSHINHLIHHRGQLSVYLRLNDVPVPAMYGPSADERM